MKISASRKVLVAHCTAKAAAKNCSRARVTADWKARAFQDLITTYSACIQLFAFGEADMSCENETIVVLGRLGNLI